MSTDSAHGTSEEARERWFAEEVHAHEPMLRAWLRSRFPAFHDIDDVVQEAYLRVLSAFDKSGEPESAKALLFRTARNLVIDQLRHRNVERLNPLAEVDSLYVIDTKADVPEAVARQQEQELLVRAIQSLPKRCRQVVTLRKIYGMSQKEVAAKLGIAEHTVEAQGTIGMQKMAKFFECYERGANVRL